MAYPIEEKLKNVIEEVRSLQEQVYHGHQYGDVVFHGRVVEVMTNFLRVIPFPPHTNNDYLEFKPLDAIDTSARWDHVVPINVDTSKIKNFFAVGDIITYWRYTPAGDDTEGFRGSLVTMYMPGGLKFGKVNGSPSVNALFFNVNPTAGWKGTVDTSTTIRVYNSSVWWNLEAPNYTEVKDGQFMAYFDAGTETDDESGEIKIGIAFGVDFSGRFTNGSMDENPSGPVANDLRQAPAAESIQFERTSARSDYEGCMFDQWYPSPVIGDGGVSNYNIHAGSLHIDSMGMIAEVAKIDGISHKLLSDTNPKDCATTPAPGVSIEAARYDHVHKGLFDGKVKADSADTTPDYLTSKIIGDEVWIHKELDTHQVKISHIGPDTTVVSTIDYFNTLSLVGTDITLAGAAGQFDAKGHFISEGDGGDDQSIGFTGDTWIGIVGANGGLAFSHKGADSTVSATITPIALSGTTKTITLTPKQSQYDSKGHFISAQDATTTPSITFSDDGKWTKSTLTVSGASFDVKYEHQNPDATVVDTFDFVTSLGLSSNTVSFVGNAGQIDGRGHYIGDIAGSTYTIEYTGDSWLVPVCTISNNDITTNYSHADPQAMSETLDPVIQIAETTSGSDEVIRITFRPIPTDAKGHVLRGADITPNDDQTVDLTLEKVTVITAIQVDGLDIQVKTRDIYIPKADAESDWTTIHTGTNCGGGA